MRGKHYVEVEFRKMSLKEARELQDQIEEQFGDDTISSMIKRG